MKLKTNHKSKINYINDIYDNNKKKTEIEKEEQENFLNLEIQNINNLFKNEINNHNKILTEQQKEFIINKKNIEQKKNNLFKEEKIKMFFILDVIKKYNYKNFICLMKQILKNEFFNLKKVFLWRKKYIFIKFFYNQKLNLISIEKNFLIKKEEIKIKNNNILLKNEKYILDNNLIQKLNCLELELRMIEIEKKYKLIKINSEEDIEKNEINFIFEKQKILEELKLKKLSYQKKIISLKETKEKKELLLKIQIKIEKINLKCEYLKNILQNYKKIDETENTIINLKNDKEYYIQKQNIIFEQNKKKFTKRNELKKIHFQYLIEKYNVKNKNNSESLDLIKSYIHKKQQEEKIFFVEIKEKLNLYLNLSKNEKIFFSLQQFVEINELLQIFIEKIKDKQFKNYYLWIKQFYNLKDTKLQQKINLNKDITEYYEQNIFFLKNLIQQNKSSWNNLTKNNILFSLEKKIKKYENFYIILKKKYSKLQTKKQKNKINYLKKINKLKKEQNKKIQENNFYQKKIFLYLEKIEKLNKKKILFKNFLLSYYKKKAFNYWFNLCKKIILFNPRINLTNEEKLQEDKNIKNNIYKYEKKINWIYNLYNDIIEEMHNFKIKNVQNQISKQKYDLKKQITLLKKISDIQFKQMKDKMFLIQLNLKEAQEIKKNIFSSEIEKFKKKQKEEEMNLFDILKIKENIYKKTIFLESEKNKINKKTKKKEETKILKNFILTKNKNNKKYNKLSKKIKKIKKNELKKIAFLSKKKKIYSFLHKILHWWKYIKEKKDLKKNTNKNKRKIKEKIQKNICLNKKFYNFLKTE
nr:hypothetical protein F2B49_01265 [Candidatus Phytoplasma sacchari]